MRTLYLDLNNGVAGDMLASALLSLFDNKDEIIEELNSLNIPKVKYSFENRKSHGLNGLYLSVLIDGELEDDHHHDHHHHGHHLYEIKDIVSSFNVSDKVKEDVYKVYDSLALAESVVHGEDVNEIHFHEVGNLDAIADITSVCLLMDKLKVDRVEASKICVGSGMVKCAHGLLNVPAPASLELLHGIPFYQSEKVNGEIATPTGIALVRYFCDEYKLMEDLNIIKTGTGIGNRDFGIFTGLRIHLCEK